MAHKHILSKVQVKDVDDNVQTTDYVWVEDKDVKDMLRQAPADFGKPLHDSVLNDLHKPPTKQGKQDKLSTNGYNATLYDDIIAQGCDCLD